MGREYSNRRPGRASAPNQFLVVTVTFLLGYLTATVFDIETVIRWLNAQVLAHHPIHTAANQQQEKKHAAIPPKPKFEFYTLLTNEKVPHSQSTTNTTAPKNQATAQTVPTNPAVQTAKITLPQAAQAVAVKTAQAQYIAPALPSGRGTYSVQVASFKARQDAEHMKGLLILKGFNVAVIPISHASRGNWFRVVVGPYANKDLAQKAQIDLAKNEHLRGMITAG